MFKIIKKIVLSIFVFSIVLFSCQKENLTPPDQSSKVQQKEGQRIISEISIGESSVTFIANAGNVIVFSKNRPGEKSLLGEEMNGLTFAQIHKRLAPNKSIPKELINLTDKYDVSSDQPSDNKGSSDGTFFESSSNSKPNARTEEATDVWFSNNYCSVDAFWNGYNRCSLNQSGPGPFFTAASAVAGSKVYVYPYAGNQVHLQGRINDVVIFDADLLTGFVYSYHMNSGQSIFGCRINKKHAYYLSDTTGDSWHWSFRSDTHC